jgi:hypothetical protein
MTTAIGREEIGEPVRKRRNVSTFFLTGEHFLLIPMNSVTEIPRSPEIEPGVARQGLWLLALTTSSCRSLLEM